MLECPIVIRRTFDRVFYSKRDYVVECSFVRWTMW